MCASGHPLRMRPSNGSARTTSPIAPSSTIRTRRGAICGAMASGEDILRLVEAASAPTLDHNDADRRRKERPRNCSPRQHPRIRGAEMVEPQRNPGNIAGPITFALLILIGLLAIHSIEPPPAVDENEPAAEFSSARAMRDVREIAKEPHPLGSTANDRVRQYLVGRLRELGANPEVQTATVTRHLPSGPDTWGVVNNIVAKIPSTSTACA